MADDIFQRKKHHLDLCATDQVAAKQGSTLLECVRLMHQSLPELATDNIDLSVNMFGKTLRAPIMIAAMTGGTDRAASVNQTLAKVAEARGYGLGLGSQRAMQKTPESAWTFNIRTQAPSALVFGNIGVVQAKQTSTQAIEDLCQSIGADALCVHMNPAMELIQTDGDRDFRGCLAALERLTKHLSIPVVAKETGNGISRQTAHQLAQVGVTTVDVSGSGGTSWVGVETLRAAPNSPAQALGELLWDWGVPTAPSVVFAKEAGLTTIATGGIQHGFDIARAIALGASMAGLARPVLQALTTDGEAGVHRLFDKIEAELRAIMLLCGASSVRALQQAPRLITGELKDWLV